MNICTRWTFYEYRIFWKFKCIQSINTFYMHKCLCNTVQSALWVVVCTHLTPQTILWIGTVLWLIGDSQRVVFATNIFVCHLFSKNCPQINIDLVTSPLCPFLEFRILLPKTDRKEILILVQYFFDLICLYISFRSYLIVCESGGSLHHYKIFLCQFFHGEVPGQRKRFYNSNLLWRREMTNTRYRKIKRLLPWFPF